jgi:hypothetical protein
MDFIYGLVTVLIGIVTFVFGYTSTSDTPTVDTTKSGGNDDLPTGSNSVLTYGQVFNLDYPYRKYFATKHDLDAAMQSIRDAKLELTELKFNIPMLKLSDDEQKFNYRGDTRTWVIDDPSDDFDTVGFVSDYFNQRCRVECRRYNEKLTPKLYWEHNKRRIIDECIKNYGSLTWHNLEETMYKLCKGCTTFRPKLLSSMVNEFGPESILDISSGWGDRLAAAIATRVTYLGCDPNSCLHPGYKSMIKLLGNNEKLPDGSPKYKVLHDKFQECKIPSGRKFDMVFTSPPYYDVEEYSHEKTQSINEFNSVDAWFNGFLVPSLDKAWKHLNIGGLLVLHINNTPGKPDYVVRMRDYINSYTDAEYLGILGKVTNGDGARARPIWIWKKVDVHGSDEIPLEDNLLSNDDNTGNENEPTHKSTYKSTPLYSEYADYLRSIEIKSMINKLHPKVRPKLEQLVERWYLININETKSHKKFCECADDMFIETCREKYIMKPLEAEKFLSDMKNHIVGPAPVISEDLSIHTSELNGQYGPLIKFSVGKYSFTLTADRVEALRHHAIANGLDKSIVDEQIMACALRYASIFAYGRQWCAGLNVYEDAAADGATIEGMASPFNAQILRIAGIVHPKFCSLFPDIEAPLGSIGSFFDCDFENSHVVVNPPRVEEVIENVVDFCIDQVSSRKCKFTMILPLWEDAKFYTNIKNNQNATIDYLDMDKYYSEDPFNGEVKKAVGFKFIKVVLNSM